MARLYSATAHFQTKHPLLFSSPRQPTLFVDDLFIPALSALLVQN